MSFALALLLALDPAERRLLESSIQEHLEGHLATATKGYREVLSRHDDFVPARLYLAQALWLDGRREEARRELTAASNEDLLIVQWLRWRFGEPRESDAIGKLQRVYPFERERFIATGTPTLVLIASGDADRAWEDYQRLAPLDPGDARLHGQIGDAFFQVRHGLAASRAFEQVVEAKPEDGSAWRQLGSSYLLLQRFHSAATAYERALSLSGEDVNTLLALGYAYERRTDFDEALDRYRRASRLAPSAPEPHYRIGRALLAQNETAKAEKALRKAIEMDGEMVEARCFLGELYLKRGELGEARSLLEEAVRIDPESFEAYYHLAQLYRRTGEEQKAREALSSYERLKRSQRDVKPQEHAVRHR